jgi:ADP-heptose:LPS heptosyltransferase
VKLDPGAFNSLPPVDTIFAFCRPSSQTLADNLASLYGKPSHRIDPFPQPGLGLHVSQYQCRQLEELGIPALPSPAAVIAPSQQDLLEAGRFVQENVTKENKLILLHPGSGGRKKLWPASGWLDLIRRMSTHNNLQIALLQGPADGHMVQQFYSQVGSNSLLPVNNWPLGKLAALMKESALYLGNDSGISHLAAACTTPTIALFGPTDARIWGPQGPQVSIVRWQPESSAHEKSETRWESPPEAEAVWKLARTWLGI